MISSDVYIIKNGASRICLLATSNVEAAHFVYHNTLDSRLTYITIGAWRTFTENSQLNDYTIETINNGWFQLVSREFVEVTGNDMLKTQRWRAKMLSEGYEFLTGIINSITTKINFSTYFLSLEDLKFFPDINVLAPNLADAVGISLETAKKQLQIEKESLLEIVKYKKQVVWKYSSMLLKITNEDEYQHWRDTSRLLATGLGRIPRPEL